MVRLSVSVHECSNAGIVPMGLLLLMILLVFLLGTVPAYPYSKQWGYGPAGFLGLLAVVLLVLLFMGTIPWTDWTLGPTAVP